MVRTRFGLVLIQLVIKECENIEAKMSHNVYYENKSSLRRWTTKQAPSLRRIPMITTITSKSINEKPGFCTAVPMEHTVDICPCNKHTDRSRLKFACIRSKEKYHAVNARFSIFRTNRRQLDIVGLET